MKLKVVFFGVVTVALAAVFVFSPVGVLKLTTELSSYKAEQLRRQTYENNLTAAETDYSMAKYNFEESRTFDVYYGDIARIREVLVNVAGIEVREIEEVDPSNQFLTRQLWVEGSAPEAVKFNMLVTDVDTAIGVFNQMQLPIYSISYGAPNEFSVIFLTGGEN